MTREEAIKRIKDHILIHKMSEPRAIKILEALDIAINALEQEPCDDVISRQAAKKALEDRFMELQKRHSENRYETNFCLNTILELPPVTPQPKTGHWIFVDKNHIHAHCPRCGYGDVDLMDGRPHNFCANCGAKMEVEE